MGDYINEVEATIGNHANDGRNPDHESVQKSLWSPPRVRSLSALGDTNLTGGGNFDGTKSIGS